MGEQDYVAYHGFVYLKNAISSHQYGLRIQMKLCHEDDFKDFKDFKKHRKNRAGSGLYRALTRYEGEEKWDGSMDLMFITWSLSPSRGATITFELDDYEAWVVMRSAPALDAGDAADKVELVLIELDDEGKPINVEQRAKLEKMALKRQWPKGGAQSKRAARLCRDSDFRLWVAQKVGKAKPAGSVTEYSAADAADWMRKECDLDSRAQLDHDSAALQRFQERVIAPYLRSLL
jgi:hypothetical protein